MCFKPNQHAIFNIYYNKFFMLDKNGSMNQYGLGYIDGMCQYKCYTKFNIKFVI